MAITGIPPNSGGGGYGGGGGGAQPPHPHHVSVCFQELAAPAVPTCEATVRILVVNGDEIYATIIGSSPAVFTQQFVHGDYIPTLPTGTSLGAGNSNPWGWCRTIDFEFQLRDGAGNGVEIDTSPHSAYITSSPASNPNPGTPTSFMYSMNFPQIGGSIWNAVLADFVLPPGNYTYEIRNANCNCQHIGGGQSPNPQVHNIPVGPGSAINSSLVTFAVPTVPGCGQPTIVSGWLCNGDYRCIEYPEIYGDPQNPNLITGGMSNIQVMTLLWNMGKNMWGRFRNFGWTESRAQVQPNGVTHIEPDQSVDLTRPGEILDGLEPDPIANPGITINDYINALPENIGAAIPDMPANPVSNAWTTAQGVSPGGATTYSEAGSGMNWILGPGHVLINLVPLISLNQMQFDWNPSPNTTPNGPPNPPATWMVGGVTSYRGVVEPPLMAINPISFGNDLHGTPTWTPFHDSLSSCIACCGDHYNQFDENGAINPYYGPYMTPPGWGDPQNPVLSNNPDFEAWLDGTNNPWGIPLPRVGGQVWLYKFYNGAQSCGGNWID